jgi:inositol 3-alpha-galactosyltransferase
MEAMTAKRKGAYVTFLAGDGDYVKGVMGLAKGLRKVKAAYPLVVAVLPDVPESHRRLLTAQGCVIREIEPVYPPDNNTQFAMPYYVINYSKLRIWEVRLLSVLCVSYNIIIAQLSNYIILLYN